MSNARSPREVCSTTIGTKAIVFLSLVSAGLINTDLSEVSAAEDQGRCRFYTDSHQLQAVSRLAQPQSFFVRLCGLLRRRLFPGRFLRFLVAFLIFSHGRRLVDPLAFNYLRLGYQGFDRLSRSKVVFDRCGRSLPFKQLSHLI